MGTPPPCAHLCLRFSLQGGRPIASKPMVLSRSSPSSISSAHHLALGINNCLHVLSLDQDESDDVRLSLEFAPLIDALGWSPCGRFVALSFSGKGGHQVQLVHLASKRPLPAMSCPTMTDSPFVSVIGSGAPNDSQMAFYKRDGQVSM